MERATVNGATLDYEAVGSGEPVLLVGTGPFADSFLPLLSQQAVAGNHRLIRYRQRGQVPGPEEPGPASFVQHAADAAALLKELGIQRAHVAGHSTGATIALQLALDHPDLVGSLVLLEPPLMSVPAAADFLARIGPALEAFAAGDGDEAMMAFLTVVTSLEWDRCREIVGQRVPGAVSQALSGAPTFFGSYLPALPDWSFGPEQAGAISQPVLSLRGTDSDRLFQEGSDLLLRWIPDAEECEVEGVAHLLHIQRPEPVARCMAEFFSRHPIEAGARAAGGVRNA